MRFLLIISFLFLSFCDSKSDSSSYVVRYGTFEVGQADFIKKLMNFGLVQYGPSFFKRIHDPKSFEQFKEETLEQIVTEIYFNKLANEKKIVVTDQELEDWIRARTSGLDKEKLLSTLKSQNLTYKDWKALFKNQLLQHKVMSQMATSSTSIDAKSNTKKEKEDGLYMAVLTFEDKVDAEQAYKSIRRRPADFEAYSKKRNMQSPYKWVRPKDLSFYEKIKDLRNDRVSKPISSDWGFLIVKVKKKGNMPEIGAENQVKLLPPAMVSSFKNDPALQINLEALHSLKLKK